MVGREEKGNRYRRFVFYLRPGNLLARHKRILREVVSAGRVQIVIEQISETRMDLVWPKAVTGQSAKRLRDMMREQDSSFETLSEPQGIPGEHETTASVKKRRVESESRPMESATSVSLSSRSATLPIEMAAVGERATRAAASSSATASVFQQADCAASSSMDDSSCQPLGGIIEQPPEFLHPSLLPMKYEEMIGHLLRKDRPVEDCKYIEVTWNKALGQGSYGVVYAGVVRKKMQYVAVKTMPFNSRINVVMETR